MPAPPTDTGCQRIGSEYVPGPELSPRLSSLPEGTTRRLAPPALAGPLPPARMVEVEKAILRAIGVPVS